MESKRCLECNRLRTKDGRRGLCRSCYRDPYVRERYAPLPRGTWRNTGWRWDALNRCRLIELFDRSMSDKQIAVELGRSGCSVTKQRQRMGLRVSPARQGLHRRKHEDCS